MRVRVKATLRVEMCALLARDSEVVVPRVRKHGNVKNKQDM